MFSIIGVCDNCGAQQLNNGMIMVDPEQQHKCTTHDFRAAENSDPFPAPKPPPRQGRGANSQLPMRDECDANDDLANHQRKVEQYITQTQGTIETLDARHAHWRRIIDNDFQRVLEKATQARERLTAQLDDLVRGKQEQLSGQLQQYNEHHGDCQRMLDEIFRRINEEERGEERKAGIVKDSKDTVRAFPVLKPIPIAVAAECQTQPLVDVLENFGAILESDIGRLPTVQIDSVNERNAEVSYTVIDAEDAEEKQAVNFIPNLQVEVQASVYATRSLGWEVSWSTRVPCEKVQHKLRIDTRSLPQSDKIYVRARTVIIKGDNPEDPIRISKWSEVAEMDNKNPAPRPNPRLPVSNGSSAVEPPVRSISPQVVQDDPVPVQNDVQPPMKKIFVVCVDPATNAKLPCRPAPPYYMSGIQAAAIRKWGWQCSAEDIKLQIRTKAGDLVSDLSVEEHPNNILADVWDRNLHFVHLVREAGENHGNPGGNENDGGQEVEPDDPNIAWPRRLMVRIKQNPSKESPARPSPLKVEDRSRPGGWLAALQKRYCERFNMPEEGPMQFYFVDDEGNRVKDVRKDSDLLYAQENRKVYAVGEVSS